jgi:signal transduction histidine kinase/ActR/RegA family two-component response regulator
MLLLTGPSQDSTVAAVLDGQADVGFVRSGLIEVMARNNKLDRQRIKIINLQNLTGFPFASSTRLFPEWPVVVMPQVDDVTARKLTIALLSLPPDGPVVRAAGIDGFANPANYSSVENLQQRLRLPPFNIRPEVTLADLWRQYDRWIVAFGILAMLLIGAGISLWILYQQARKAQRALAEHGNQLERLVENRTRELETAKDAAETANRAKSTFLSNMSHELRTPMNAIMGMTGISLRKATDPQLIDRLTKVDQASQHLLAVINDILDISKIEAERMTLEHANFTLGEVTESLVDLLDHKAQAKMTRLSVTLAPELATRPIVGDALRLGQILINFTGNAIKFTERGSITVRASVAAETATDLLLRFEVQDTGIGISATDQLRLFTAFEQADGSTTRKYGGSGLGLAISKRLAQLMGGEVGVESAEGRGSTFWCTVRVGKAKPSLIAGAVPPAPTFSTVSAEHRLQADFAEVRLLLAEDEPVNREVSRGLLEDIGLQVDIAEDGVDAVAMAQATRYDLILMDMQMPRLNGVDATRQIRQLPGYAHTPILAMTANAFDEDRQVCLAAGMNDHIAKPVNPTLLFKTLLVWLERSRTAMH